MCVSLRDKYVILSLIFEFLCIKKILLKRILEISDNIRKDKFPTYGIKGYSLKQNKKKREEV